MPTTADKLADLAESFPTLRDAPGVRPFDITPLYDWATGPAPSRGAYHAAMFVLSVYNPTMVKFDVMAAFGTWDREHISAFLAWGAAPWFA